MDAAACEICRGNTEKQMLVGKILHAEKWNKVSKTSKRSRKETLREIKTFKSNCAYWGKGVGETQKLTQTHDRENAFLEKT